MAATETETPEATPADKPSAENQYGTLRIEDLDSTFSADGSTVDDLKAVSGLFDSALPSIDGWLDAHRKLGITSAAFCEASFWARTHCRNHEQGIDWGGNTEAYKVSFASRITRMQVAAGMTDDEIRQFGDKVRRYSSDNDGLRRFQAEWLASHDPATGEPSTKLEKAIVPVATGGLKILAPMAEALRKEARKQVKKDGTILDKWKDVANYAKQGEIVGLKKAAASKVPNTDGSNAPSAKFEQVRSEIVKTEKKGDKVTPHLAPATVADEVLHLETSAAIQLLGNDPDKAFPVLAFDNWDREATIEKWKAIAKLATAVANALTEPEKAGTTFAKNVQAHYWNPGASKK